MMSTPVETPVAPTGGDPFLARVLEAVGDRYTALREIGRGGMAVVYAARDRRLPREVALKVLPPDLAFRGDVKERFLREAQLAARLNHASIVPIYSVDEGHGMAWITMALVDGESLAQRLQRDPPLSLARVRDVLAQVADGLAYAHAHGVVHRDIKPDNILLERGTGRAVLTDFGIARAVEQASRLTATGIAVGTPAFMSPEQALGDRDVDGRADQYALAVVARVMLTGRLPYEAENTPAMLLEHVQGTPRPIALDRPDLPADFVAVIERAMSRERRARFPTAAAFRDALRTAPLDGPAVGGPAAHGPVAAHATDPGTHPSVRTAALGRRAASAAAGGTFAAPQPADDRARPPFAPDAPARPVRITTADDPGRVAPRAARDVTRDAMRDAAAGDDDAVREANARIARFRWSVLRGALLIFVLLLINGGVTQGPPWFLVPSFFIALAGLQRFGRLYEDGIRLGDVLRGRVRADALGTPTRGQLVREVVRDFRGRLRNIALGGVGAVGSVVLGAGFKEEGFLVPAAAFAGWAAFSGALALRDVLRLRDVGVSVRDAIGERWRERAGGDAFASDAPLLRRSLGAPASGAAAGRRGARTAGDVPGDGVTPPPLDAEVLASAHGDTLRRAADDWTVIHRTWARLDEADRGMVPDVQPTADALFERARDLGTSLARLEGAVETTSIASVEARVASVLAEPANAPDRDRRVQLLERQLASLRELDARRQALAAQLERATLALHTLRLDVLKLRALGVGAALGDVTGATQEARALSRDIARAVEVADDVRGI